jgi:hypothetical protein
MANIKNDNIPSPAADFFGSMKAADLNIAICRKYGIKGDSIPKYLGLVAGLFHKTLALSALVTKIKETFSFDEAKAKNLALDIAGARLLVANDWIGGVAEYIEFLGGDPVKYAKLVAEQVAAVKKEKEDWEAELKRDKDKEVLLSREKVPSVAGQEVAYVEPDLEKEKADSLNIFSSQLAGFLSLPTSSLFDEYNDILIGFFSDEKGVAFRDQIVRAILENEEKISSAPFFLTKKPVPATIGNWLKYFIKEKGSALFDNIVLTNFLTNSDNARVLKDEEKNAVKKLLLLYRNLKFFPESMPNETGEGWEIIPSAAEAGLTKAKTVSVPLTADYAAKAESPDAAEKEEEKNKEAEEKIAALEKIAAAYPAGSFQRKAVEAEIRKLSKK